MKLNSMMRTMFVKTSVKFITSWLIDNYYIKYNNKYCYCIKFKVHINTKYIKFTKEIRNIVINLYNTILTLVIATQDSLTQICKVCEVYVKLLTIEWRKTLGMDKKHWKAWKGRKTRKARRERNWRRTKRLNRRYWLNNKRP